MDWFWTLFCRNVGWRKVVSVNTVLVEQTLAANKRLRDQAMCIKFCIVGEKLALFVLDNNCDELPAPSRAFSIKQLRSPCAVLTIVQDMMVKQLPPQ